MSYPPTLHKTYTTGEILTAADLNSSIQDISDTNIPEDIDDYSVNVAEMQTNTDPYPAASESLPTTLAGELERIRFQIKSMLGEAQWYIDPDRTIASLATLLGTSSTVVLLPDGAVGTPSLSFASDTDTGIYLVGADNLGLAVAGSLVAQLSTAGIEMKGTHTLELISGSAATPSLAFSGDTDTGIFLANTDDLGISVGGVVGMHFPSTQTVRSTLNGSISVPVYSFDNSTTTGMYLVGSNNLGFTVGSALRLNINTTAVTSTLPFYAPDGLVGTPGITFGSDPNSGLYSVSADTLGVTAGGTQRLQIDGNLRLFTGQLKVPNGSAASPAFTFAVDATTGLWFPAASTAGLAGGGVEGLRIDNSAVAGQTRLLLYDVDNGQLERVTVGVADSGGAGYKVLRIPN